ncbi:MAG: hypothetical protein WC738_07480, partial [Candidatus Omnitrophota bacterium]
KYFEKKLEYNFKAAPPEVDHIIYKGKRYSLDEFRASAEELFKNDIEVYKKIAFNGEHLYRAITKSEWREIQKEGIMLVKMEDNFEETIGPQVRHYAGQESYAGIIVRIPVVGPYFRSAGLAVPRITSFAPHYVAPEILVSDPAQPEKWVSLNKYLSEKVFEDFMATISGPENILQRRLIIAAVNADGVTNPKKIREIRNMLKPSEKTNDETKDILTFDIMRDYLKLCGPENFDDKMKEIILYSQRSYYEKAMEGLKQKTTDFQNTLVGMGLNGKEGVVQERISPTPVSPEDAKLAALIAEAILSVPSHPLASGGKHEDLASSGRFKNGYQLKLSTDRENRKLVEGMTPYGYFKMALPDDVSVQDIDNHSIAQIVASRAIIRKIVSEAVEKRKAGKKGSVKQRIRMALDVPIMDPDLPLDSELSNLRKALERMMELPEGQMRKFVDSQTLPEEFKSVLECILQPSPERREAATKPEEVETSIVVPDKDSLEVRNKATVNALQREEDPASRNPVAVIGLPMWIAEELRQKNINPDAYLATLEKEMSRMFGKKGYGDPANVHTLKLFFMEKNTDTTRGNLQKVLYTIKTDQEVVIFAPKTKIKGTTIEISEASLDLKLINQFKVMQDAYNDIDATEEKGFPDISTRITITRLVAWCKYEESRKNKTDEAQKAALDALKTYLSAICAISDEQIEAISDSTNLSDLLKQIGLLKIKPVDYKDITDWRDNYKAVATAL